MGNVVRIPLSPLAQSLRNLRVAGEMAEITIRFLPEDDLEDLERTRWDIQGLLQRRGEIITATGFKKRLSQSGAKFTAYLDPAEARKLAKQILVHVEAERVRVTVAGHRLGQSRKTSRAA